MFYVKTLTPTFKSVDNKVNTERVSDCSVHHAEGARPAKEESDSPVAMSGSLPVNPLSEEMTGLHGIPEEMTAEDGIEHIDAPDNPPVIEDMNEAGMGNKSTTALPWVDVIRGNRLSANGHEVEFIASTVIDGIVEVFISEEDVATEMDFWSNTLVMYVLGEELSMNAVKQFMSNVWNFISMPELYYNDTGYFPIQFRNAEDRDMVLRKGPYTIYRHPMFLKKWSPKFELKDDMLRVVPIWVILP